MKNRFLIMLFLLFVISYAAYAEEDIFAELNFETSEENINTTAISTFETAGSENLDQTEIVSENDIFALIESESSQSAEEVFFPKETDSSKVSSTADSSTDIDFLFSDADASTEPKQTAQPQQVTPTPTAVIKETPKKWVIKKIKSIPTTNFIYTKDGRASIFRNLKDHLVYKIKASSEKDDFSAMNIKDNFVDTAWVDNGKKEGIGENINFIFEEINFAPVYEKKYKAIEIKEIKILNGFCKDLDTWQKYNRVKKFKILLNDKIKYYIDLHDSKNWQIIKLPVPITIKSGDKIKLEIMDIYPEIRNAREANTAISEIYFIGGPTGKLVENKYIASHLLVE